MLHPKLAPLLMFTTLALPSVAAAQAGGNAAEAIQNKVEKKRNNRQRVDDRVDLASIRDIVRDWDAAVRKKDAAAEKAADERLAAWLRREMREERREVGQAKGERRRSRAELGRSRREARTGGAKDQRDRRDDRRDLRDDQRDLQVARAERTRIRKTAAKLRALQPAFAKKRATPMQYKNKRVLLQSLIQGEKREVRQNRREVREDRRERKEDRRERKEDRRRRR